MLKHFKFVILLITLEIGYIKCPPELEQQGVSQFSSKPKKIVQDVAWVESNLFREFVAELRKGSPDGPTKPNPEQDALVEKSVVSITKYLTGETLDADAFFNTLLPDFPNRPPEGTIYVPTTGEYIPVSVDEVRSELLERHNAFRKKHGLELLSLDTSLNDAAQQWATKIANAKNNKLHDLSRQYGQSIFSVAIRVKNMGLVTTDVWYSEVQEFNTTEDNLTLDNKYEKIVHVVQMLWKTSTKLGGGIARDVDGKYYVVAHYLEGFIPKQFHDYLPQILPEHIELGKNMRNHYNKTAHVSFRWTRPRDGEQKPNSYERALALDPVDVSNGVPDDYLKDQQSSNDADNLFKKPASETSD